MDLQTGCLLGFRHYTTERVVDRFRRTEVDPQFGVDRHDLANVAPRMVSAPGPTTKSLIIDLGHLLERGCTRFIRLLHSVDIRVESRRERLSDGCGRYARSRQCKEYARWAMRPRNQVVARNANMRSTPLRHQAVAAANDRSRQLGSPRPIGQWVMPHERFESGALPRARCEPSKPRILRAYGQR